MSEAATSRQRWEHETGHEFATAGAGHAPRHDLYTAVHKGLRAALCEALLAAGRLDTDDPAEVGRTLAQVRGLLALCRAHLHDEDRFIHPALEARRAGSTAHAARQHRQHLEAFTGLAAAVDAVECAAGTARAAAALALYRMLGRFVAENLEHMQLEETEHNAALWATHSDDELRTILQALLAAMPAAIQAEFRRWMVPAMTPSERVAMLAGMKRTQPPEAFAAALAAIKPHLGERDWNKLLAGLAGL